MRRKYTLGSRAEGMESNRQAILNAAFRLFAELNYDEVTLEEIARRAQVSLPTVTRHFAKKEAILKALWQREVAKANTRRTVPIADAAAAAHALVTDYERVGRQTMRALAAEDRFPELKALLDQGRAAHRDWIAVTFAPWLAGLSRSARARRIAQIALVCDVYGWKFWRLDFGLSPRETAAVMREALEALGRSR